MPGRNLGKLLLTLCVLLLAADRAVAYVGPGADVAFISYAMTLLLWMLAAFSAVLLWPVYALVRMIRRRKDPSTILAQEPAPEDARGVSHSES